ncbi:MAG: hypothetical protein JO107_05205 [Hyphomicrobiales bacterium]|nr:hypothetical protein [Hyphomicrobiales bacterium]
MEADALAMTQARRVGLGVRLGRGSELRRAWQRRSRNALDLRAELRTGRGGLAALLRIFAVAADQVDQPRQLSKRIFNGLRGAASRAQMPLEFVEIDFRYLGVRAAHDKLR